jgi:hypothetical protein
MADPVTPFLLHVYYVFLSYKAVLNVFSEIVHHIKYVCIIKSVGFIRIFKDLVSQFNKTREVSIKQLVRLVRK